MIATRIDSVLAIPFYPQSYKSNIYDPMTIEGKAILLFDGQCAFCQRSVALLKRLDWFRRVTCLDLRDPANVPALEPPLRLERLMEEMHIVTADRHRVYPGFRAFRWLAWRLPLTIPIAPLLYLPGVLPLGQHLYLWVARNRFKLVPCTHGGCQLPVRKP
jgi:predicted DCC family thiol-disulfide oxidoreductase YuxK